MWPTPKQASDWLTTDPIPPKSMMPIRPWPTQTQPEAPNNTLRSPDDTWILPSRAWPPVGVWITQATFIDKINRGSDDGEVLFSVGMKQMLPIRTSLSWASLHSFESSIMNLTDTPMPPPSNRGPEITTASLFLLALVKHAMEWHGVFRISLARFPLWLEVGIILALLAWCIARYWHQLFPRSFVVNVGRFNLKPEDPASLCGRSEFIRDIFNKCTMSRLTFLVGDSGAGKSALLLAGLIPELRKNGFLPIYVRDWGRDWERGPALSLLNGTRLALSEAGVDIPDDFLSGNSLLTTLRE